MALRSQDIRFILGATCPLPGWNFHSGVPFASWIRFELAGSAVVVILWQDDEAGRRIWRNAGCPETCGWGYCILTGGIAKFNFPFIGFPVRRQEWHFEGTRLVWVWVSLPSVFVFPWFPSKFHATKIMIMITTQEINKMRF